MRYEQEGLFIGLVSYPFYIDGKQLYTHVVEPFFRLQHRQFHLEKMTDPAISPLDDCIYKPQAYRMFGTHGLAIFSLIDDFSFCSRIFNSSHIRPDQEEGASQNADNDGFPDEDRKKYKAIVLTGTSETLSADDAAYLVPRAKDTFLAKTDIYPFVEIMRLKINSNLLFKKGVDLTRAIKRKASSYKIGDIQSIIVDSYDNDELIIVIFSSSMGKLDSYTQRIRRMTCSCLRDTFKEWKGKTDCHLFSAFHMSYGHHVDYSFKNESSLFRKPDAPSSKFEINCLIETKPGHRKKLIDYLRGKDSFKRLVFHRTVTGGSIIRTCIPLSAIDDLHQMSHSEEAFKQHVRRIKLTLSDSSALRPHPSRESACPPPSAAMNNMLGEREIDDVRKKMLRLGVSKIVRERLLALLDLFNDCGRNKLQSYYFQQMEKPVRELSLMLDSFLQEGGARSLFEIENMLNEEITSLENAIYNRMLNNMTPNTILEYGGGIQQMLQGFNFAYQRMVELINPSSADKQYAFISGVAKESSDRSHTELNINHIIYPQLFATTGWKEASNFALSIMDSFGPSSDYTSSSEAEDSLVNEVLWSFSVFNDLLFNDHEFEVIRSHLFTNLYHAYHDRVFQQLISLVQPSLIRYALCDYIVYHFAFQRNFELMWYNYFKVMLQTSSVYQRPGQIRTRPFLFILLRLMLVGLREQNEQRKERIDHFIQDSCAHPFDYLLSNVWLTCFSKTKTVAEYLLSALSSYDFPAVSERVVFLCELNLLSPDDGTSTKREKLRIADYLSPIKETEMTADEFISAFIDRRKEKIDTLKAAFENLDIRPELYPAQVTSPDNIVCLLHAFLLVIHDLDFDGKDHPYVHSLIRAEDTREIDLGKTKRYASVSSHILADPTGGFVIPDHAHRKKYFAYLTCLYQTLWDMSYKASDLITENYD